MQRTFVVGERIPAERLASALSASDREVLPWSAEPDPAEQPGSSAGLARALIAFERELGSDSAVAVVLADDSDAALAAALVALKQLVRVEAAEGVAAGTGVNARLISQLTGT